MVTGISRLIVWRHGRTAWNASGRFQGQTDIGLDDLGRAQVTAGAAVIAERYPVDRIVASDLSRASATAAALAERTGLAVDLDPRLREIHVGEWAGLTHDEVTAREPWYPAAERDERDFRRSASGETTGEVADRVVGAFHEIATAGPDGGTVVAAMHGLAGRVGLFRLVGLPPETWGCWAALHNAGWAVAERTPTGRWRLRAYNLTADVPTAPLPDAP